MKRKRTTRIYASVPKLRTRASKKMRNEENTLEYNDMENDNTSEYTEDHHSIISNFEEENLLDLTTEEATSSKSDEENEVSISTYV